ncbi:MAG: serine hydrolase domain-containing protein [Bacteroidota bacterium]
MFRIVSIIPYLLLLISCVFAQGQDSIKIEPGKRVEGVITQNEKHTFLIDLNAGQFVYGNVNQKDVSVRILVFNPNGKQIGTFNMNLGQEGFYIESIDAGRYQIVVAPLRYRTPEKSGEYSIEMKTSESLGDTPEQHLDQILNALYKDNGPGGTVIIVRDGEIIYSRAFGLANVAHNIPFTPETPSNIGSVSKQFTGFAVALLEKEGKLSIDDDIRKYIPNCPDYGQPVTLLHLLNHTSGFRGIKKSFGMRGIRGSWTREELIQQILKQTQLKNAPGSEYRYVNTGYILLAEVVQQVSGASFRDWMRDNIFAPLGMENTMVNSPLMAQIQRVIPNSAQGYANYEGEYGQYIDEPAFYGASSIYSSAADLSKWLKNFSDPRIGGREVISQMTKHGLLTSGDTINYGFGLKIDNFKALKRYSHSGSDGFHWTEMTYFPDIDAGIIILNNFPIFPSVSQKISELFLHEDFKPLDASNDIESKKIRDSKVDPALLNIYAGHYSAKEDDRMFVTFVQKNNGLSAIVRSNKLLPATFKLSSVSDSTFVQEDYDISVTFHLDTNRQVKLANFHYSGDFSLHRLSPYEPSEKDLLSFTGIYYSQELESVCTIFLENNLLKVKHPGGFTTTLEPMHHDMFSGNYLGEYLFERSDSGTVSGFIAESVHFEKLQ